MGVGCKPISACSLWDAGTSLQGCGADNIGCDAEHTAALFDYFQRGPRQ